MTANPPAPAGEPGHDELFSRDFLVCYDWHDDEGRPFAEIRASEHARAGVPMELRSCPYAGSRLNHPRPMNHSALRQMGGHWTEMMKTISWLRAAHLRRYPRGGFDVEDLLWTSSSLLHVQNHLMRRADRPVPEGGVPGMIAGMFKAALGVSAVSFALCVVRWLEGRDAPEDADAGRIHAFAEEHGLMVGLHGVCGGPPRLIDQLLGVVIRGEPLDGDERLRIRGMLPDVDGYLEYATAMMKLELARQAFIVRHHALVLALAEALRATTADTAGVAGRLAEWVQAEPSWRRVQSSEGSFNRWIAARDEASRERVLAGMARLIERFDAGADGIPLEVFRPAATRPAQADRARARNAVRGTALAAAAPDEAACLEDALARCFALQARALEAFDALRPRLAAALGRPAPGRYTEADLARATGATLPGFLEGLLAGPLTVDGRRHPAGAAS